MVREQNWIPSTPIINNVSSRYEKMLSEEAIEKAGPYLREEQTILENYLAENICLRSMNCCVVGGGSFHYLLQALSFAKTYTLVEPFLNLYVSDETLMKIKKSEKIKYFDIDFETFCRKSNNCCSESTLYIFWFNVILYINNPIEMINKIIKKGDIIFVSGWMNTLFSHNILVDYFNYVNCGFNESSIPHLPTLENLSFENIKHAKDINTFQGNFADIRIINT